MITRQPSPPAANGRRFGTMSPRRTRYVIRNQGVLRNRKNRFHTWTAIFSGLTERCDATFLINSCPPFFTRPSRKRGPASPGSYTRYLVCAAITVRVYLKLCYTYLRH